MTTLADRIRAKVPKLDAAVCWPWQGHCHPDGYGRMWDGTRWRPAHRMVYELEVGPIPDGLQLDHLCRNRSCVNPAHLEPVTNKENGLRGISPAADHARQTHCLNGHEFTDENTYMHPGPHGLRRVCRICKRARDRAFYEAGRGTRHNHEKKAS